jgi:hypothetical protein
MCEEQCAKPHSSHACTDVDHHARPVAAEGVPQMPLKPHELSSVGLNVNGPVGTIRPLG